MPRCRWTDLSKATWRSVVPAFVFVASITSRFGFTNTRIGSSFTPSSTGRWLVLAVEYLDFRLATLRIFQVKPRQGHVKLRAFLMKLFHKTLKTAADGPRVDPFVVVKVLDRHLVKK